MNHIQIYDNILSKKSCDDIIEVFERSPNTRVGVLGDSRAMVDRSTKDSTDLYLYMSSTRNEEESKIRQYVINALSVCTQRYKKKYPFLNKISPWMINDSYNIQKFDEGQGYHGVHCEHGKDVYKRMLVWMIYLNNAKCGTRFYYPRRDVKARQGRVVLWPPDWTHPHSGITPNKGKKYIVTGWFSYN